MSDPMYDRTLIEKCDLLATMKMLYQQHCESVRCNALPKHVDDPTARAFVISIGRLQGEIAKILKGK